MANKKELQRQIELKARVLESARNTLDVLMSRTVQYNPGTDTYRTHYQQWSQQNDKVINLETELQSLQKQLDML